VKIPFLLGFVSSVGLHAGIFAFSYALFSSSLQIPESDIRQFQGFSSDTLVFDVSISDNGFASLKGSSSSGAISNNGNQSENRKEEVSLKSGGHGSLQQDSPLVGSPIEGYKLGISPGYPRLARERGEQGRAVYEVKVDSENTVEHVTVLESSGSQILDESGKETLLNSHISDYRGRMAKIAITYSLN
jgi:TonB family protein